MPNLPYRNNNIYSVGNNAKIITDSKASKSYVRLNKYYCFSLCHLIKQNLNLRL